MTLSLVKYEYKPLGTTYAIVPSVQLIDGQTGVIHRVDFYKGEDFFRDKNYDRKSKKAAIINIGLGDQYIQEALFGLGEEGCRTLERLTDEQLKALGSGIRGIQDPACYDFPLEELIELRYLERELRRTIGDYRGR